MDPDLRTGQPVEVDLVPATAGERAVLWSMMREELADQFERITQVLGLSWEEFEAHYATRGEVCTLRRGGEVAGYCWIELRECELHLHAIMVLPAQRGRGIGSAALRRLEAEFRDHADVIELGVSHDNPRARSLYERVGFVVVTTLHDVGYDIMRKPLTEVPLA